MSLEERTLVVRGIDGDKLSNDLLEELFSNFGPVVRVVLRPRFAFIEYTKKESVGYAWAMTEGICLQGKRLWIAPKLENDPSYKVYRDSLQAFTERLEDPSYVDSLLTPEQLKEKNEFIASLNSSLALPNAMRNRLLQYDRHYEPGKYFNPILQRDLSSDSNHNKQHNRHWNNSPRTPNNSHRRSNSSDRGQSQYNDNGFYQQPPNYHYHSSMPDLSQTWSPNYNNQPHQPNYGHFSLYEPNYSNYNNNHFQSPQHSTPRPRRSFNDYDIRHPQPYQQQHYDQPQQPHYYPN